ncbi:MAG: tRNA (adenosine(37)-N6)-threonylcarbamoyltransferase complex ATPase subunit type 1 TsaE [Chitinophagaceae bacterium]|nr:tRNA (adenosine(37)-N6)-threonylcarbamoyltransferase complex ATPase subunit type 1 TsaE [Chitinophagaceae bacterium]
MQFNFSLHTINAIARQVWNTGKDCRVWALHGEMGTGKTTFIHSLCQEVLQVTSAIGSPTYSIINEYTSPLTGSIFHMDWYRLSGEEEALQAGVEDALYSNQLCLVEWPDRAANLLPPNTLHIYLELLSQTERSLRIQTPCM